MSTFVIRRPAPARVALLPSALAASASPVAPVVALERDGEDGLLVVEAPGLDPARDLAVSLTGDRLTVSGTRRRAAGPVRSAARFSRTVVLPEGTGAEAVTARYDAGVLRVRVAGLFPVPVVPETVAITIASDVAPADGAEGDQPAAAA